MQKEKIQLIEEKETLFVPLLGKALEGRKPHPILRDEKAEEIISRVEYDFSKLNIPRQSLITLAMRAKKLDEYTREFLAQSEDPLVLHLGCGLDSRVERVSPQKGRWFDLDYPEVIELRRKFYDETDQRRMIASSVMDLTWLDEIEGSSPACIIAEGLLMYLTEKDVRELFARLHDRFPGSLVCFDTYSRLTVSRINKHPSIQKTGARIYWGIDDVSEIEQWDRSYHALGEWYFTQSEDIANQSFYVRLMFKTMGLIKAACKAHRIARVKI